MYLISILDYLIPVSVSSFKSARLYRKKVNKYSDYWIKISFLLSSE